MRIKKTSLKRAAGAVVLAALVGAVLVGVAAAGSATIVTSPVVVDAQVFWDLDGDGLNDPEELVGIFDVYDGMQTISVSWNATSFPAGANGSYYVSLWQNTTPFGAPTWNQVTAGHHWASNPNGTQFTVGPFAPGQLCVTCPSKFLVQPETYVLVYNAETDSYSYAYTTLSTLSVPAALEELEEVVINVTDYSPPEKEEKEDKGCVPELVHPTCMCEGPDEVCRDSCGNITEITPGFCDQ